MHIMTTFGMIPQDRYSAQVWVTRQASQHLLKPQHSSLSLFKYEVQVTIYRPEN